MDLVAVSLEGRALVWFHIWNKLNEVNNWLTLSTFDPSKFENPRRKLF